MSPARVTVRIDGVQALLRDLRGDPVHAKPWREALEKAAKLAEQALGRYVPGGRTHDIKSAVDKRPVPLWARARMPSRKRGKFRYLGALHGSKRIKFHYRSGPFRGQPTFNWFEKARASVRDKIVQLLSKAERDIEKRWGRR